MGRSRRRGTTAVGWAAAVAVAAAPAVIPATIPAVVPAVARGDPAVVPAPQTVAHPLQVLTSAAGTATAAARQAAAADLLGRRAADARAGLNDALANAGNPDAQAAVARAVAAEASPDPALFDAVAKLLGGTPPVTATGAAAVANYRDLPRAFDALRAYADNGVNPVQSRADVVRAMGGLTEKRAAGYLVEDVLGGLPPQPPKVRDAADAALRQIAGMSARSHGRVDWPRWWAGHQNQTDAQWQAYLLGLRAAAVQQARTSAEQDQQLIADMYRQVPPAQQPAALVRLLSSPNANFRDLGLRLVIDNVGQGQLPTKEVVARVVEMLADPDADVRWQVAEAVAALKEATAVPALLGRLSAERDPAVRLKLADTVGTLAQNQVLVGTGGEVAAAPVLAGLAGDPDPEVAAAAARVLALKEVGPVVRRTNPAVANQAGAAVKAVLANPNVPDVVRTACIRALGALQDPEAFRILDGLAVPPTPVDVRRAALAGLGALGDGRAEQTVANQLNDDPDPAVRYTAAVALRSLAKTDILALLADKAKSDTNESVRGEAWLDFAGLLDQQDSRQLQQWVESFKDNPDHRLAIYTAIAAAHRRERHPDLAAQTEQDIAKAMTEVRPPRLAEAAQHLRDAMAYWQKAGLPAEDRLVGLICQTIDTEVAAKDYKAAVDLAEDQIGRDQGLQGSVIQELANDAIKLKTEQKKPAEAKVLIGQAMTLTERVKLDTLSTRKLQEAKDEINAP